MPTDAVLPLPEPFLRDLSEAARGADPKLVADAVAEALRRQLSAGLFLEERFRATSREGFTRHLVHEDPAGLFLVVACGWLPQQATPVHDHAAWGVIGALSNRVIATTWRRLDDGSTPGFASITETSRLLVSDSSFALVRPPEEAIHRLENPFRDPALTLHVFGRADGRQSLYEARNKMVTEAPEGAALAGV